MDIFPSLFPLETTCPPVSDQEFNLFHSIDRELYTRLIRNLGREPVESMKVMAFWLWLEREGRDKNFIQRMLSLPPALVNQLADETVVCLKCVETEEFLFLDQINVLPQLLSVSLRFFHENRDRVVNGVSKIITTVCLRAFNDILHRVLIENAAVNYEVGQSSMAAERRINNNVVGIGPMMYNNPHPALTPFYTPPSPSPLLPLAQTPRPGMHMPMAPVDAYGSIPAHLLAPGGFLGEYEAELQPLQMVSADELGDMLSRNLILEIDGNQSEEVLPDDRTIFLTFSKGYPTTEDEVREFFTRRFGDFIEDLIMQEVEEGEQVLYARMVARSGTVIDTIVRGNKAKYSINGKHVWARKYVKRAQQQQQTGASSSAKSPRDEHPSSPFDNAGLEP